MKLEAMMFDVGGTVFDWYSCLMTEFEKFGKEKGLTGVEWNKLARSWRAASLAKTLNSKREDIPLGSIDGVNRFVLDGVLKEYGIQGLSSGEKDQMTMFWHRMKPWEDSAKGIEMLRSKYFCSVLTILSVALISTVSKNTGIRWDLILSCQMMDYYKCRPEAYLRAAEWIRTKPEEIMMVAAHSDDLPGAARAGFRTGFIYRPDEWGKEKGTIDTENPKGDPAYKYDVYADNLIDFAKKMDCG